MVRRGEGRSRAWSGEEHAEERSGLEEVRAHFLTLDPLEVEPKLEP